MYEFDVKILDQSRDLRESSQNRVIMSLCSSNDLSFCITRVVYSRIVEGLKNFPSYYFKMPPRKKINKYAAVFKLKVIDVVDMTNNCVAEGEVIFFLFLRNL